MTSRLSSQIARVLGSERMMFAHTSWKRSSDPAGAVALAARAPARVEVVAECPRSSETYACTSSASLEP